MESSLPIDAASQDEARRLLRTCCGSSQWVERMLERRPFGSEEALRHSAREVWFGLSNADWREAFSHHPKIGDRESLRRRFAETRHLSEREQAGVEGAAEEVLAALARANRDYENTFGHIFIICASGLTADEMLGILRERMENDPHIEIRIAAEEQAKITDLRLRAIMSHPAPQARPVGPTPGAS
jgi:2-oxo-4-hydroxy-4-carboxy-5-ureidoimidazoline decarboxylase